MELLYFPKIISSLHILNNSKKGLNIKDEILDRHPILKYRVNKFMKGEKIRGILPNKPKKCHLVLDDSVVAGEYHYPCVIYMREQGSPIGKVNLNMRRERLDWRNRTNVHKDPICKKNCLDVSHQNYLTLPIKFPNGVQVAFTTFKPIPLKIKPLHLKTLRST